MNIKELLKGKSLTSKVRYAFLAIILLLSMGFSLSLYEREITSEKYDNNMDINIKLSQLSVELSNSWGFFDSYMKTHNEEFAQKYMDSNTKINGIMDQINGYVNNDTDSSIYLRNLSNMFDDYKASSSTLMNHGLLDEKNYGELVGIKTLVVYMNKHSELLTVSFLNYSNAQYTNTVKKYKNTEIQLYTILMIIVIVSFSYSMSISRDLRNTIGKLRKHAELLSGGNWEIPDIEDQKYEEFNSLSRTFNKMKNSIRRFINELNEKAELESNYHKEKLKSAEKDKLIKETQLLALQSQMNPHFLFNTLNTISRMAMFEGSNTTVELIEATSKILRYNLDYKDKLVKLKEEIDMTKAYVTIQQTRFQDQMSFNFEVDDSVESILVPPMILQPLVENAIIHGLRQKDNGGLVEISVKLQANHIVVKVRDNGVGIEESKIKSLLSGMDSVNENRRSGGLGLGNVLSRIGLYFNRRDLVKIESTPGKGTDITILIPIEGGV